VHSSFDSGKILYPTISFNIVDFPALVTPIKGI
jgi:hypothetical protein